MSKIDKIMEKYVQSTAKGRKHDLEKLEQDLSGIDVKSNKKASKKIVVIPIITVLAMLIVVIVPILVLNNQEANTAPQYFSSEIMLLPLSVEDIKDEAIKKFLPKIETLESALYNMKSKTDNNIIGMYWEGAIYDDFFNSVNIYYVKNKYIYSDLVHFSKFSNQVEWQNVNVKFEKNIEGEIVNNIYIESDNYNVYIQASSVSDKDIVEILDLIFC